MRNHLKFVAYLAMAFGVSCAHAGSYEDFFQAVVRDDPGAIVALLRRGFDPNALDPQGRSGLIRALQDDSVKAAETLVDWPKTDINWASLQAETPLMLAAIKGDTALARKLIARGAYVNMPGWTPLHYAASGGHADIIQMLLDESAYIDAESPNKTTPLMMAAQYGSPEAVKLLLDSGADPALRNELGLTALDFARRGERPDAIRMLTAVQRAQAAKQQAPRVETQQPSRVQTQQPSRVQTQSATEPPAGAAPQAQTGQPLPPASPKQTAPQPQTHGQW